MINYSNTPTLPVSKFWSGLTAHQREFELIMILAVFRNKVELVDAKENGYVILSLVHPLPASERGELLLEIEQYLKEQVDQGITVWLDPQGDKSSLRKLRGVEIRS